MPPSTLTCFKAYDIRGRLGDELIDGIACRIGRAYVRHLGPRAVAPGADVRPASESLKVALAEGLMDGKNRFLSLLKNLLTSRVRFV